MTYWDILLRFGAAVLSGGVIGYERETGRHPAGLRTHILVCAGAAMLALIECLLAQQAFSAQAGYPGNVSFTLGRMSAQVISGIGFLGAGTIITTKRNIAGLTTAASLWAVACIGIAAGMGLYGLALIGAAFTLIALTLTKRAIIGHSCKVVEIGFRHRRETLAFLNDCFAAHHIRVLNVDFRVEEFGESEHFYTNVYTLDLPRRVDSAAVINEIAEYANVQKVKTREP